MASRNAANTTLGVMVTGRTLHASLLEQTGDGPRLVRTFTRQRSSRGASTPEASMGDDLDALEESGSDFNIQFGDEGGSDVDNMFIASEFGGLEGGAADLSGGSSADVAVSFALELADILAECEDLGYARPSMAFALEASDVSAVELHLPDEKAAEEKDKTISRKKLVAALKEQHGDASDDERVAFLRLTPTDEGVPRYLAVTARAENPVTTTLSELREEKRRLPPAKLLDTEVPLYLGLGRSMVAAQETDAADADPADGDEPVYTLMVRVGSEDTLVLFLENDRLNHTENLRSLTAVEPPETICSRVLLLQDEYGIGEITHVLLASEDREDDLADAFEMFFPEAYVRGMRDVLPPTKNGTPSEGKASTIPATLAALRLANDEGYANAFADINFLPSELRRRQFVLPVTWHIMAMYVVLFCTVLFFVARFFTLQGSIQDYRDRVNQQQPEFVDADPNVLQARIDSLQNVHAEIVRGLDVLEDLMVGSDRWSRAMEKAAREMAVVEGLWVDSWQPSGNELQLRGSATSRDGVVTLAERLDGRIETLSFTEIREWPVYAYTLRVPLSNELPEAAVFLRERIAEQQATEDAQPPMSSAAFDETID